MTALEKPLFSEDTCQSLIEAALAAPTADNCQPFLFKVQNNHLTIVHDAKRGEHFLNMGNIASYLALGCTLTNIEIAAAAQGLSADVTSLWPIQRSSGPQHPLATIEFRSGEKDDSLYAPLWSRATDRRRYKGGSLNDDVFLKVAQEGAADPVGVHLVSTAHVELIHAIARLDRLIWTHAPAHQGLMEWLRLNDRETENMNDGMPWPSLGVSSFERRLLQWGRAWNRQKIMNCVGGARVPVVLSMKLLHSSAGLVILTVTKGDLEAQVAAGKVGERIWLQLNAAGYGVQPLSLAPILGFARSQGALRGIPDRSRRDLEAALELMRQTLGLADQEIPIWMFRTGLTTPLPPSMRSPRRHWREVLL